MNESDVRFQDTQPWQKLYRAAILETNMGLVPRRVREARKAVQERAMQLIREAADGEPEIQDLLYASLVLDEWNRKCQSDRHSGPKQPTPESQGLDCARTGISKDDAARAIPALVFSSRDAE